MSDDTEEAQYPRPRLSKSPTDWQGGSAVTAVSIVSWVEILAVAVIAASLYVGLSAKASTPVKDAVGWDTLTIDGNRAERSVLFPHADHQKRIGEDQPACKTCHHMSKPMDGPTSCYVCHRDMYLSASIFDHVSHQKALGSNRACKECHVTDKARENSKQCKECHETYTKTLDEYVARSYESAMHSRCVACHKREAKKIGKPKITKCQWCHKDQGSPTEDARVPPALALGDALRQ